VVIVLGVLVIVTRAPLIFRPTATLESYRAMFATDARARAIGGLYLGLGVLSIWILPATSGAARTLLIGFAALTLAMTGWSLFAPGHFRGFVDGMLRVTEGFDPAAIRAIRVFAVIVGVLLVNWGVQAL
jgi:hypothetical protein